MSDPFTNRVLRPIAEALTARGACSTRSIHDTVRGLMPEWQAEYGLRQLEWDDCIEIQFPAPRMSLVEGEDGEQEEVRASR